MKRRIWVLVGWIVALPWWLSAACSVPGVETDVMEPSPLVLSEAERSRAVALAEEARGGVYEEAPKPVADAQVTKEIVTAVTVYPGTDETDDRRLAAVTSFDYRTGQAARVVVDLSGDQVVQALSLPGSSAPAAPEEVARLRELLVEDSDDYRKLLAAPADSYDLGTFVSVDEGGDLAGHRIILVRPVYFRDAPRAPIAIVDLTADRVLRYEGQTEEEK